MTKEEFLKMKKELEAYGNKIILITIPQLGMSI